jgi:hypothetical protein
MIGPKLIELIKAGAGQETLICVFDAASNMVGAQGGPRGKTEQEVQGSFLKHCEFVAEQFLDILEMKK